MSAPMRPQVAVLAVTRRGDQVLLVQRRNPPDAGKWGFPGGRVELGETLIEAACRELREETAVEAEALGLLTALDSIHRGDDGTVQYHFVLNAVLLDWQAGEAVAGDDAAAVGWMTLDQLATDDRLLSRNVLLIARQALAWRPPA